MKVLRAMMLASVCALAVGSTSAPLLDGERTNTNVVIVETPATRSIDVAETSTTAMTTTTVTTTTVTTGPAEVTEMATTTDVLPAAPQDLPVVVRDGALPNP